MIPAKEFIAEQRRELPVYVSKQTCSGGTYIVTGSNVGLGYETVQHLVRAGAKRVIIAVRNIKAGEAAKATIEAATNIRNVLDVWELDLASYISVKSFAKMAVDKLERIDALIENAGVAVDVYSQAEGHEMSTTINVLSTMLLAVLLLPKMMEDAQSFNIVPHVTIVTSEGYSTVKAEIDKIKDDPLVKMDDQSQSNMADRYEMNGGISIHLSINNVCIPG
jgi:NAD(P)-dependent dehydrogenase (short-subunit alcohol dehydrogenase family)